MKIALIGYGEVGHIPAEDLLPQGRPGFAQQNDWRIQADRVLEHLNKHS